MVLGMKNITGATSYDIRSHR